MEGKRRMLSPSSINLYRQCPRKYYYAYIEKLPTKSNIHLLRGSIVHSILEEFFNLESDLLEENYYDKLIAWMLFLLKKHWDSRIYEIRKLAGTETEFYEQDTKMMLINWLSSFSKKIGVYVEQGENFSSSFRKLTPQTEVEYNSEKHQVRGFIDAIEEIDGVTKIIDYKTSDKLEVSEDYKLQLAIYALLYYSKHNKLPQYVGINFLRGREVFFDVNQPMIEYAKKEVEAVQQSTLSIAINDYSRKVGPFCKWANGQCDFFEICKPFEKKKEESS